jgi:hypothetical protein
MARSKGFSRAKQRVMKPLSTRGGRTGSVKVLSSEDHKNVGRPGHKTFAAAIESGKASVRRLMVRDPAKGISDENAAKHIHHNADPRVDGVSGEQRPQILTAQPLPPKGFGSGKRTISNRGTNRSIKKR